MLSRHFPSWAARRAAARSIATQFATYADGVPNRTNTPWNPSTSSLNVRGGTMLDRLTLRQISLRGVEVHRNNPIARTLAKTETSNIVGDGFTCKPTATNPDGTLAKDFNKEARDRFYDWFERADITGLRGAARFQQMCWEQPRIEGDGLVVMVDQGGPSRLQYIGRQQIETPYGELGNPNIIDGVEVDPFMRPAAFWVRGDSATGSPIWTRVVADNAIYLAHLDSPLSVRGVSVFNSVFALLDQLDGYIDAVCLAARAAAALALIFRVDDPQKAMAGIPDALYDGKGDQRKAFWLEGGSFKFLGQKGEVAQVQAQQPMQQTPDFIRAIFKLICLAFEMPVEIGGRDLSQVNFSGGRIGLIQYYRACREKQDFFVTRFLDRVYHWWISREKKLGRWTSKFPENYWAHEFMGREWDFNDPLTEAQADHLQIAMGILSPQMASAQRGRDFETVQQQISEARTSNTALGIPNTLPSTTRDETTAKGLPGSTRAADAGLDDAAKELASFAAGTGDSEKLSIALIALGLEHGRADALATVAAKRSDRMSNFGFARDAILTMLGLQMRDVLAGEQQPSAESTDNTDNGSTADAE